MGRQAAGRGLVRSTVYSAVGRFANLLAGLLLTPYILDELGSAHFALWVLAFAFSYHLSILFEFGSSLALIRRVALHRAQGQESRVAEVLGCHVQVSALSLVLKLLCTLALLPWLGPWLGLSVSFETGAVYGVEVLLIAALGAIVRPLSLIWDCLLQACERFDDSGRMAVVRALCWAGLVVGSLESGLGVRALLVAELVTGLVIMVPGSWLAWRALGVEGRALKWPSMEERTAHWRFALGVYVSLVTDLLNSHSDKLVLSGRGRTQVKAYELGQKLTLPVRMALALLGQVLFPAVPGVLEERGEEGLARLHRLGQKLMALGGGFVFGVSFAAAPSVLRSWLGPGPVDEEAVLALRLLSVAACLSLLSEVPIQLARGLGRLSIEVRAVLVFSVGGLLARLVLLGSFGFPGLLAGAALTALATTGYLLWAFAPLLGYSPLEHLKTTTLKPLLAAVLAVACVMAFEPWWPSPDWPAWFGVRTPFLLRLILESLLFSVVFGLGGWLLGAFDGELRPVLGRLVSMFWRRSHDEL